MAKPDYLNRSKAEAEKFCKSANGEPGMSFDDYLSLATLIERLMDEAWRDGAELPRSE